LALLVSAAASCAHRGPTLNPDLTSTYTRSITLYGRPLSVYFALPSHVLPLRPLLLFATGDGGFRGKDRELFEELASFGYPVAGFSARTYLKNLGYVADTTTPRKLGHDYEQLIAFSERALGLPANMPVVLVGNSRGAGLSVVAAGQRFLQARVCGVLAIALISEEEHVRHYRLRRGQLPPGTPRRELVTIQPYEYLPRLSSLPVAVIQSTKDGYLRANEARKLFGPDSATRQLHAVNAWSHSFMGARAELYAQVRHCLDWICTFLTPTLPAGDGR
jgi:pimeloyl-ACP methyl ester carboxylesterase